MLGLEQQLHSVSLNLKTECNISLNLLSDENPGVRACAADSLGKLKIEEAIPQLADLVKDKSVSRTAAGALVELKSEESIPFLIPLLKSENPDVRDMARVDIM